MGMEWWRVHSESRRLGRVGRLGTVGTESIDSALTDSARVGRLGTDSARTLVGSVGTDFHLIKITVVSIDHRRNLPLS